jgi:anti-sigma regulatory factor (Ser/Thr protein kinase)
MGASPAVTADPDVVSCTLTPRHDSVRHAREFTRSTLRRWGLDALFDDIALVASELVTNALRHGVGLPAPDTPPAPGALPIRLSLVRREPQVVCAVSDPSSSGPVTRTPENIDFEAECGRGLQLVASFSESWGWHPVAAGKVVWALFMDPSRARH